MRPDQLRYPQRLRREDFSPFLPVSCVPFFPQLRAGRVSSGQNLLLGKIRAILNRESGLKLEDVNSEGETPSIKQWMGENRMGRICFSAPEIPAHSRHKKKGCFRQEV